MSDIEGRHVVVTGGSRGLGRAMVLGLVAAGANVTAVARAQSAQADETVSLAVGIAGADRLQLVFGDLQSEIDCQMIAAEATSRFGAPHILVNNAAIPMAGAGPRFFEIELTTWQAMVRTNIEGSVLLTALLVPGMLAGRFGRIINISTGTATMVRPGYWPYGPTKAFMDATTRIWADELNGTGVTVNALLPGGAVDTAAELTGSVTPGRTFLPSKIVVPPLLWLASSASEGHTGRRLNAKLWDETLPLPDRLARADESRRDSPVIL
jgi:NAD(P)-dependent dehydrogenase (short-subunit alcohol dehydrogenase family)